MICAGCKQPAPEGPYWGGRQGEIWHAACAKALNPKPSGMMAELADAHIRADKLAASLTDLKARLTKKGI